ncbi:MAG: S8 family serine peptidase, partial [Bacteroidia bacterium]
MSKIDHQFYKYLFAQNENPIALPLPSFVDSTAVKINGEKYFRCKVFAANPLIHANNPSLITGSVWPNFFTARLSIQQIIELANNNDIIFIEAAYRINLLNDFARAATGVASLQNGNLNNTTYTGTDVLVGVIDAGIDWQHGDFIDPLSSTTSRIYSLWDQDLTVTGSENTPYTNDANLTCCNFGVEYTNSEINNELSTSNGDIRNAETSNHGTHVAGTAAGNGNALSPAAHIGMAPNAEIVFVNTDFSDASIIDALDYMDQKATDESKPIVVNLSLGSDYNAHDGTSALAQAIDAFSGTGRAVVCAAGNEGDDNMHFSGTIPEGGSHDFSVTISSYTPSSGNFNDFFQLLIYIQRGDSVTCEIDGPNGSNTLNTVGSSIGVNTPSDGYIYLNNSVDANNTDRKFHIDIYDAISTNPPAQGTYTFTLNNINASAPYSKNLVYHVWLYNKSSSSFQLTSGNNSYIVGSPASAAQAISVGSFVHRWRWQNYAGSNRLYSGTDLSDDISAFSSSGPLRTGETKPEIAAPGQGVISSLSSFSSAATSRRVSGEKHFVNQGTSMSCPVVTGSVALLLESNPSLSASSIKNLITANAN